MASYIFGGSTGKTQQDIQREREYAEAMLAEATNGVPRNEWEGIAAIGKALSGQFALRSARKKEAAGRESAAATVNPIIQALSGKSGEFPPAPGGGGSSAKASPDYKGDDLAWTDAKPYQKALLNTIAGPESGGRYNVIYGGGKFDDFSKHPGQAVRIQTGPNAGRTSSAAGKYQFLGSTWDDQAGKLGLSDFSPANQDKAAWNLAAETYKGKTGQELDAVLQSGDPAALANVGKVLNPIWTSLPGGIEQGTNTDKFVASYQRALSAGASPAQAKQVAQQEQTQPPVQVASLDPSAGVAQATQPQVPPMPEEYAQTGLSPEAWAKMNAPTGGQGVAKALAGPSQQPQPAAPQGQQVAQALSPDRLPVMAGGNADAIQPGQGGGLGMQQLLQAAQNPWLDQQQRGLINMLIEQEQQKNDPLRQMQLQKGQIEIDALKNPRLSPADQAKIDFDREQFQAEQADKTTDNQREDAKFKFDQDQAGSTTGTKDYDAYAKDERAARRQPLGRLEFEQAVRKAGASNTTVSMGGGDNKQVFEAMAESATAARAAQTGLASLQEAKTALDAGIISGAGADWKLALQKVGAGLGVVDPATIINTETFRSAIAPQVAAMMKATVGSTQISNADREFAEKAAGGSINLDQGSIKRLVDIMERAGRASIEGHMDRLNKVYPEGATFDRERALFGVNAPAPVAPPPTGKAVKDMSDEELEAIINGQ
jgi:muramidase (phage lysozyme)